MPISSLQTYHLNIESISGCGKNSKRASLFQRKCNFCGGDIHSSEKCFKRIRKEKEKILCGWWFGQQTYGTHASQIFRCGSEDHIIAKFPKPPKENEKQRNKVCFNEKVNHAYDYVNNNSDQKIAYMAGMSGRDECPSGNFGDSSQLSSCILDSVSTCHMTP